MTVIWLGLKWQIVGAHCSLFFIAHLMALFIAMHQMKEKKCFKKIESLQVKALILQGKLMKWNAVFRKTIYLCIQMQSKI